MMHHTSLAVALLAATLATGATAGAQGNPQVTLETNKGVILIELYPDKAPKSVANFLEYVRSGFYAGTVFHRVIDGFMIQGGGFTEDLKKKDTRAPVENESENGLSNARGTIAMARTSDPDSATAQFYINSVDNEGLDSGKTADGWGYTVFGKVIEGMEVVDEISKVQTHLKNGMQNVPREPVVILSAKEG
jgi:cyclophilin family peptidyl-prolyl cis-trans isomerase